MRCEKQMEASYPAQNGKGRVRKWRGLSAKMDDLNRLILSADL